MIHENKFGMNLFAILFDNGEVCQQVKHYNCGVIRLLAFIKINSYYRGDMNTSGI